jgi:hypothetical protein
MKVNELKRFYQFHADEFAQAMLALLGVITVGILPGLAIEEAVFDILLQPWCENLREKSTLRTYRRSRVSRPRPHLRVVFGRHRPKRYTTPTK